MVVDSLPELMERLKPAQRSLERIREEYKGKPDLLRFYEPSAEYLVSTLKKDLSSILQNETGFELSKSEDIDLWIRIDGDEFHEGKGPIGVVGNFLNKFNHANKFALKLVSDKRELNANGMFHDFTGGFDLAATATGSLKLGFKKPSLSLPKEESQLDLFSLERHKRASAWDSIDDLVIQQELVEESINLVLSAVDSAQNEEAFQELAESYSDKDILKLIHLAKEIVPSSKSSINSISFERKSTDKEKKLINTNKETRKMLSRQAKRLTLDREFISGKGMIRGLDLDERSITIRPLEYEDTKHDEIKGYFNKGIGEFSIQSFLDRPIALEGFIIYSSDKKLLRLEIEKFEVEFEQEN